MAPKNQPAATAASSSSPGAFAAFAVATRLCTRESAPEEICARTGAGAQELSGPPAASSCGVNWAASLTAAGSRSGRASTPAAVATAAGANPPQACHNVCDLFHGRMAPNGHWFTDPADMAAIPSLSRVSAVTAARSAGAALA